MDYSTNFRINELSNSDLDSISFIHVQAFPKSALTLLGQDIVKKYYEWQLTGPHDVVFIGAFNDNELIGFCLGGIFRGSLGGFLEKNRNLLIKRVLIRPWLLLNPTFRERTNFAISRTTKFSPKSSSKPKANISNSRQPRRAFGILSIAVLPLYHGKGVANLLMEYLEATAIHRGFNSMSLTVHPSNLRAIAFYEKMGWQKILLNRKWSGKMRKVLSG